MGMENGALYLAMVIFQFAQVGLLIASKKALLSGMTTYAFAFYSSAFGSLILLPVSSLVYRSSRPPISFNFICCCFLIGLLGFSVQIIGYVGVKYAPASIASAILNLIPGFTFVFAVIFRMEKLHWGRLSTVAKAIGTVVTITGALIATLYFGPVLLKGSLHSTLSFHPLTRSSNWVLGGFIFVIDSLVASIFMVSQAFVLKRYPVELLIMFFYSIVVAILSAISSFIIERDFNAWSLRPKERLFAVIYAGCFGNIFQVTIVAWCVRKKGPLFAAMFHPLGIIVATVMGVIILGDTFYLGSLIGSVVIVIGFYAVMWGKAQEWKMKRDEKGGIKSLESGNVKVPLLQDRAQSVEQ